MDGWSPVIGYVRLGGGARTHAWALMIERMAIVGVETWEHIFHKEEPMIVFAEVHVFGSDEDSEAGWEWVSCWWLVQERSRRTWGKRYPPTQSLKKRGGCAAPVSETC